ncbi:uncharacterized protein LOC105629404 [Jatropha curcas]|uniref:uncharacterized protein LOC105629404 n=1 Tax=Jatropha curcas TaxID=180498 RepID=UPI001895B621|nr:uncharacterized protein LOC105629404 [Jatropha curcas]
MYNQKLNLLYSFCVDAELGVVFVRTVGLKDIFGYANELIADLYTNRIPNGTSISYAGYYLLGENIYITLFLFFSFLFFFWKGWL